MSPCPDCGRKARHEHLLVPRDPARAVVVVHRCTWCCLDFTEALRGSLRDLLNAWGR